MSSLRTLSAAQAARIASVPEQLVAPSPVREAALEGFRQRNALLDQIFYDLGRVDAEEAKRLAPRYAAEGAILRVGPSSAPSLDIWSSIDEFNTAGLLATDQHAIAVAGVGSSALGAAAFARNVADAIDRPVLAVVSGYGLSDLLTEALGGFFLFGYVNSIRHVFEPLDDLTRPRTQTSASVASKLNDTTGLIRKSLDVATLVSLLQVLEVDLLIGHSKGNLVISEALYALRDVATSRVENLARNARIVTVSARVAMPKEFIDVIDIIGTLDPLGELNSRQSIRRDISVRGASHHTNTELPLHLPVTRILKEALSLPALHRVSSVHGTA